MRLRGRDGYSAGTRTVSWTEAQEAAYRARVGEIGRRYHSYCASIEKNLKFRTFPIEHREAFHERFLRGYWYGEALACLPKLPTI